MRFSLLLLLTVALLAGCRAADGPAVHTSGDIVLQPVSAGDLRDVVRSIEADLVVVNFWASWCVPCREEFPDFLRYAEAHPEVAVRFVTVDFEDDVDHAVAFLEEQGVTGVSYIRTGKDGEFIDAVAGEWSGAIPATVIYNRDGERLAFHEGKMSYDDLAALVESARRTAESPAIPT